MPVGWRYAAAAAWLAVAVAGVRDAAAQIPGGGVVPLVDSVVVEGNQRIPADQIVAVSGIQISQPTNFRGIQRAIQALYRSGQFDDVQIAQRESPSHLVLIIRVKERPILQRWMVVGVAKLEEGTVRGRVKLLEGRALDRAALAQSRSAIDSLYRKRGYYAVRVDVEELPQVSGAVQVVFNVHEGTRIAISEVIVEGNEALSDAEVVKGMRLKPEGFWWYRKGEYSQDRLEEDIRRNLPVWYGKRGYVDFKVVGDSLIADSAAGKATLVLRVEEGQQYKVGTFEIQGNRRYSAEDLKRYFPFGEAVTPGDGTTIGGVFDRSAWEGGTSQVADLYANTGYIYAQVVPEEARRLGDDGTPYLDLRWNIQEGSPATINKIEIVGNDVTHERVIREAILLVPGQVFNRDLMIRSWQNIANLNFFEQPLPIPDVQPTANGVDVDIIYRVQEKRTGNINFGASVGQGTGVGGFIGLEEPNLFGRGKRGRLQWSFGGNINDLNLTYTDPSIRESRISGTITLFNSRQTFTVGNLGRQRQVGGSIQLGFPLFGSRFTRFFLSYGLQQRKLDGQSTDLLSTLNCSNCTRSTLGFGVTRDTRIGLPFPTAGSSFTSNFEINGGVIGGTGRYQKEDIESRWYTPLGIIGGDGSLGSGMTVVLGFTAKSGFIFGDTGPFITEQYAVGGTQFGIPLRGYDEFSITPDGFDPAVGSTQAQVSSFGKSYAAFTLETGLRVSQSLYVNTFFDAGNNYRRVRDYNPTRLFRSYGVGVAIVSPLGPIGLDVARGLDRVDRFGAPKPAWQVHFRLGNFF